MTHDLDIVAHLVSQGPTCESCGKDHRPGTRCPTSEPMLCAKCPYIHPPIEKCPIKGTKVKVEPEEKPSEWILKRAESIRQLNGEQADGSGLTTQHLLIAVLDFLDHNAH